MRTLLLICLLLLTGCSESSGDSFGKLMADANKNCNGPTKIKIHYGSWFKYVEVSCDDIEGIE